MKIANWFKDIIKDDSENDLEDTKVENSQKELVGQYYKI